MINEVLIVKFLIKVTSLRMHYKLDITTNIGETIINFFCGKFSLEKVVLDITNT